MGKNMDYTRRDFVKIAGLGTLSIGIPTLFSSCFYERKPPNIIFIMSDDHAERALSCYSKQLISTPNIDRIAQEGILFENSFVTNSICAPSRATLLTGKYSHINGMRDNYDTFDGSQMTFVKILQKAGYRTGIVGKWHLKTDPTGFDEWRILVDQGEYYNPTFIENGEKQRYTGYAADIITDKALDFLQRREDDKPFCLLMHHKGPHRNFMPDGKYLDAFDDRILPVPENFFDDHAGRPAAEHADMRVTDMYLSYDLKLNKGAYDKETGTGGNAGFALNAEREWQLTYEQMNAEQRKIWDEHYIRISEEFKENPPTGKALAEWKYQRYMKDYLACILSIDDSVGRVLDYLDKSHLAEDTVIIYTSDQGFYLGEHGWYDKRFMYEESLGMPLIMRYPREIPARQVTREMVLNLDFAPTLLDYAGASVPEEMQGSSFRKIARGDTPEGWRTSMYYHYYEYPHGWHNVMRHYGIRTERYKLIHFYNDIDHWELYDLESDPHEMKNIYGDPAYAEIVQGLKGELRKLQEKFGDTVIQKPETLRK